MNNDFEDLIKTCSFCQAVRPSVQFKPLNPIYLLSHLWEYLYLDLCSLFPSDECIFTAIDVYSRYPEAVLVKYTSSKSLIKRLESIFSKHGYPMTLKTNDGSNHISVEMEKYLRSKGIHHTKSQLIGQE